MEQWVCQAIRLSALWSTPQDVSFPLTWRDVTGSEPDTREVQPRLGTLREVGTIWEDIGSCALELRTSAGRADWSVAPTVHPDVQLLTFPNLGALNEVASKFASLLFEVAARSYSAPRFAIGIVTLHHHPSVVASYAELAELLKNAALRLTGASDFLYQINRPRPSGMVEGLSINRLSSWSSASLVGFQMDLAATISAPKEIQTHTVTQNPVHATRVELDISSQVDRREPIPETSRRELLGELLKLALELPRTGDVP